MWSEMVMAEEGREVRKKGEERVREERGIKYRHRREVRTVKWVDNNGKKRKRRGREAVVREVREVRGGGGRETDRDPHLSRATILFWMGKLAMCFLNIFFIINQRKKMISYVLRHTCLYI